MSHSQGNASDAESLGWTMVENLVASYGRRLISWRSMRFCVQSKLGSAIRAPVVRELAQRPRPRPGEFGLEVASGMLLALVVPAVFDFVKLVAKKFAEKTGEIAAEKSIGALLERRLQSKADAEATWADLEQCFAAKAKELGLPAESYRKLLEEFRERPALLLRPPKRSV